jgi:hypothetical protein
VRAAATLARLNILRRWFKLYWPFIGIVCWTRMARWFNDVSIRQIAAAMYYWRFILFWR